MQKNKLKKQIEITALNETLKKEIKDLINKTAVKILDWSKIHKAKSRDGMEFKVESVNDKEIRIYNSTQDIVWPINIILPVFNFYDDNGNLVSEMEND